MVQYQQLAIYLLQQMLLTTTKVQNGEQRNNSKEGLSV